MDEFEDIRPYNDSELHDVVSRLSRNRWLLRGFKNIIWPRCPAILTPFFLSLESVYLRMIMRKARTIDEFQKMFVIRQGLYMVVRKTTSGVTYEGLDSLSPDKGYLFISNHRDISLDSALLNYALYREKLPLCEIAFGDNLLINQFVSDMIRINKAFIVKRGLPIREQIKASITLSRYIRMTLEKGNSVWLAQREGRAKDGNDATNPSIIKMLYLSQREKGKGIPFPDFIRQCRIVPMAVSYEYDPCDRMKAWEIHHKETRGGHVKRKREDLVSLYSGIKGWKGRIHLTFGPVLTGSFESEKEVAEHIDSCIYRQYRLWPSNYIAYDEIHGKARFSDSYTPLERESFLARFKTLPQKVREIALAMYSNPVSNRLAVDEPGAAVSR
jgi:1-acyl-sn-glycerol-3-phosphate acyltransferase